MTLLLMIGLKFLVVQSIIRYVFDLGKIFTSELFFFFLIAYCISGLQSICEKTLYLCFDRGGKNNGQFSSPPGLVNDLTFSLM